jgi:pimeloyl-ACP methyl ester carboxylesterase
VGEGDVPAARGRPSQGWQGVALAVALIAPGCVTVTDPFDYLINLGTFSHDPSLAAPDDGVRRVVVLRHGLFRSAASLWKLQRALRDHGYETLNQSYGSTSGRIEDHASRLRQDLEAFLAAPKRAPARSAVGGSGRAPLQLLFVGHSLGGLQMRYYLSQRDARVPDTCVFIGTPHRGAVLTDERKDWRLFKVLMGSGAALQLSPGHPFYRALRRLECDSGVIYGGIGDGVGTNDDVPGDDDGTVGVDEAQLPEALDSIRLPLGHTWLVIDDRAIHQVLFFLRHRCFDHGRFDQGRFDRRG